VQQLVNWWDMKPFDVGKFLGVMRTFQGLSSDPKYADDAKLSVSEKSKKGLLDSMKFFADECEELALPATSDQIKRMSNKISTSEDFSELMKLLPEAMNRLEDECKRKTMLFVEASHIEYFSNAQFFDPKDEGEAKVSAQFSSAAEDIAESGKCLACGRGTACVMHLGRVMEVGLKALAKAVGVGGQNDWGKYLEEIDKELQKRMKASGARSLDEQFYAEAYVTFDSVRRAWRNPTMHVDKTYTEERAEEILIAVRSFMRHLARKLHD
jgi:hypothetical protein